MTRIPAAALLLFAAPAAAVDPRVRTVTFAPGEVVTLTGHYGYQMLVELAPDERIENISIGDSLAWAVTPSKGATALFLKPVEPNAATNMTVLTTRRTYLFELKATRPSRGGASPGMTYRLGFRYPEPLRAAAAPVLVRHDAYRLSGQKRLRPAAVHDDGRSTYFRFAPGRSVPAIFVMEGRTEALVNHRMAGDTVVIDRIASAFVLREGRDRARVARLPGGRP